MVVNSKVDKQIVVVFNDQPHLAYKSSVTDQILVLTEIEWMYIKLLLKTFGPVI